MEKGTVRVIYGPGSGKSASAIGYGMVGVSQKKKVIAVQFMKGGLDEDLNVVLKRMEPEMKVFCFERSRGLFADLSEEQKQEELINLKNGFNFARKVMVTGECDMLILDEVFGLLDENIVSMEEFTNLLECRAEEIDLILTGRVFPEKLSPYANTISFVDEIKS